jgi:hypothetical protein
MQTREIGFNLISICCLSFLVSPWSVVSYQLSVISCQ